MTRDERAGMLDRRLADTVKHAYERAPAVRAKLEAAGIGPGDVTGVDDLEKLPVTTKDELVRLQAADPPFGGFCTVPLEELHHVFVSPGPIYDPAGDEAFRTGGWLAELLAAFGVQRGQRVLNTFSYHLVPAGLGLDQAFRSFGLVVVPGGVGNTDIQARLVVDLGAEVFCGTPSFLVTLLDRCRELGLAGDGGVPLRVAVLGAEALPPSLRTEIRARGVVPIETYGTADAGMIACECPAAAGLHLSDEMVVEIVDPATGQRVPPGQPGEIVVTPFNPVYPLVRFGTGDVSALVVGPCPCGRAAPRIPRILGRVGEAVKVRGMFLHPHQVHELFAGVAGAGGYQVVVSRSGHRDELVVRVEAGGDAGELVDAIHRRAQSVWRVRPDRVEAVAPGSLGEHAVLVDERRWE